MNEELLRQACDRYNEGLAEFNECAVMALPPLAMALPAAMRATMEFVIEGTPGARWRKEGGADPHENRYDCERAKLAGGHLSDDEVANDVFMQPNMMTATIAKDRIRWLSRALEAAVKPTGAGLAATVMATELAQALIADGWRDPPAERVNFGTHASALLRKWARDFMRKDDK